MSQIYQLYRLQQLDNQIREKKQRLREVLQAQKGKEEVSAARARKEETAATLARMRAQQTNLELELGQLNAKAKRSEERLYSGRVTNPKELEDLQQELGSLGRRRDTLENRLLETMMAVEEAEAEDAEATQARDALEAKWEEERSALAAEQDELATEVNELLEERQAQVGRIERRLLSAYEATGSRHGGVAVAALQDGLCQACGVRTPAQKARAVQTGELVYCASCGRILVLV